MCCYSRLQLTSTFWNYFQGIYIQVLQEILFEIFLDISCSSSQNWSVLGVVCFENSFAFFFKGMFRYIFEMALPITETQIFSDISCSSSQNWLAFGKVDSENVNSHLVTPSTFQTPCKNLFWYFLQELPELVGWCSRGSRVQISISWLFGRPMPGGASYVFFSC